MQRETLLILNFNNCRAAEYWQNMISEHLQRQERNIGKEPNTGSDGFTERNYFFHGNHGIQMNRRELPGKFELKDRSNGNNSFFEIL
jgi:hypothetical protein